MKKLAEADIIEPHQIAEPRLFAISTAKDIVVAMIAAKHPSLGKNLTAASAADAVFELSQKIYATMKTDWTKEK